MMNNHLIIGILWAGYCIVHSIMADTLFKKKIKILLGKRYKFYRLFYSFFAIVTIAVIIIYQHSFYSPVLFRNNLFIQITGGIVMALGLIIMGKCVSEYFMDLSGLGWLFSSKANSKNELLITGLHHFVRHPLYLGTFIFIWGFFIFYPTLSILIAVSIITTYTLIAIPIEEKKLIAEFGEAYKNYKSKVPVIIPKIFKH